MARVFKTVNRLQAVLVSGDAPPTAELVASATRRVAALGDTIRAHVAQNLDRLLEFSSLDDDALWSRNNELGDIAGQIAEVAGAAELVATGEVACGLAAMVHTAQLGRVWNPAAARLHLNAMRLIRDRGETSPEAGVIRGQLTAMRRAIGVIE